MKSNTHNNKSSKTAMTKRCKWIVCISFCLCFILGATIGLTAAFRQKVDIGFVEMQKKQQVLTALNKSIASSLKQSFSDSIIERTNLQTGTLSQDELQLIEYYQSDEFFIGLENVSISGDDLQMLDYMFEPINSYLQLNYAEQGVQKPGDLLRDFFVGISKSKQDCVNLYNTVMNIFGIYTEVDAYLPTIIAGLMSIPVVNATISAILGTLKAICVAIPIIGWIALGILVGVELAIATTMFICGSNNNGFEVGVKVKTGFLGIPTGVKWVCGAT